MKAHTIQHRVRQLTIEQKRMLMAQVNSHYSSVSSQGPGQLTAFVSGEQPLNLSDLKIFLGQHLPEYLVPGAIVQLDSLPKLANGKVDKQVLEAYQIQVIAGSQVTGTTTPVEKTLIGIWEEVLDFEPIGIDDNFFEIGGDSILSIQIVSRARNVGIALTPRQLFDHQTIAQLAREVKTIQDKPIQEKVQHTQRPPRLEH